MTHDEDATADTLLNPFYAITFSDALFSAHTLKGAKEDWVLKNAQLIEEMGVSDWLEELLHILSATSEREYVRDTIISPYKGIVFSRRLQGEHEPMITRKQWITVNDKLIKELGAEAWLWRLVDVLETGGNVS